MKRFLLFLVSIAMSAVIGAAQISSAAPTTSLTRDFLKQSTTAGARAVIGATAGSDLNLNTNQFSTSNGTNAWIKSGATLTNSVLYGSTSGNWTVGSTGNLTADTARTVTTTTGALTLSSGSSHIIATPTSNFGIGTTGPDRKLDVLDAGGSAQFRTTYTDGSVYTDYQTLSGGSTLIQDSSGRMLNSTVVNNTAVNSRARQGGLAFDGVTTTAKDLHTIGANIGTSDFSVTPTILVPSSNPSASIAIATISSTGAYGANDSLLIFIDTSGGLNVRLYDALGGYVNVSMATLVASYGGKVVAIACVRNATTPSMTVYINGVAQTVTTSTSGAATWANTLTSTYLSLGYGSSSILFNSTIYSAQLFTRALSASEVVDLANKGVSESDKWANLTGQTSGTLTRGQRYRITTFVAGDSFTNVGAASNATGVEFVATGTTPTTWTNASTLNKIGCLLDADLAVGVGYQAPDRSSNKYHGVISSSGVSHVIDQRRGQIRYTTTGATTGAFQLLSGTAIPSNALIQSIVAWSAGTPLIYVGTATGTSNVVGHTTLTGSTYTPLTLSTQFSTTGNLWINKSATNEVNLTVNYMMVDP